METKNHVWQFARIGGINRVNITSGDDLLSLENLDKKLWTALSCPVHGLEIDNKTLEYIDIDKDNRIRVPEIIETVKWITSVIKNPDLLISRNQPLPLSAINEASEEGKVLLASAKQILKNLGKADADVITVEDTSDTIKIFANTKFNGDGVITEDSTEDEDLKKLINDIKDCIGSKDDRSGKQGIAEEQIIEFYTQCEAFITWKEKAEKNAEEILPFGDSTPLALEVYNSLKVKIEDYFMRCRLAAYDPLSTAALNNTTARFEAISASDLTENMEQIASFPIALIESGKALPLSKCLNPAFEKNILKFKTLIIEPLFKNTETLSEAEWLLITEKFDPFMAWLNEKSGVQVEVLGLESIKAVIENNKKDVLLALIAEDLALENEAQNIFKVDKLARFYRDIYTLLNNFVSFYDFYAPETKAVFQAGRLFIDQRSCDLCIKVSDMPKHATMAGLSGICLIYCDCYSKVKNEKMTIVAAFTNGDFDDIVVGRNAIFFDNNGLDWDATIIKIIENPISIRQAFWSPYKKFGRFINKQIEKFASDKEKAVDAKASASVEKTAQDADAGLTKATSSETIAAPATPAPPPAPFDIGKFVGIFAAIGLALGAIGSVLASIMIGFLSLLWRQMPIALLGVVLAISGPSMILAWLKLRKRNLASVLDANGWAINARITINIIFGNTLTHLASMPLNSKINLADPFKRKRKPLWLRILFALTVLGFALFILWYFDIINFGFLFN